MTRHFNLRGHFNVMEPCLRTYLTGTVAQVNNFLNDMTIFPHCSDYLPPRQEWTSISRHFSTWHLLDYLGGTQQYQQINSRLLTEKSWKRDEIITLDFWYSIIAFLDHSRLKNGRKRTRPTNQTHPFSFTVWKRLKIKRSWSIPFFHLKNVGKSVFVALLQFFSAYQSHFWFL